MLKSLYAQPSYIDITHENAPCQEIQKHFIEAITTSMKAYKDTHSSSITMRKLTIKQYL